MNILVDEKVIDGWTSIWMARPIDLLIIGKLEVTWLIGGWVIAWLDC